MRADAAIVGTATWGLNVAGTLGATQPTSVMPTLLAAGIPVAVETRYNIAHNKLMIFDPATKKVTWEYFVEKVGCYPADQRDADEEQVQAQAE